MKEVATALFIMLIAWAIIAVGAVITALLAQTFGPILTMATLTVSGVAYGLTV